LFNFPKAKIFLGDSGSYLLGTLITLNVLKTYQLNPEISPFFYAGILFYLFYEVFFSFIRKVIFKVSPLEPDKKHFHMLVYKMLSKCLGKKHVNYVTSILINASYFLAVLPLLYFRDEGLICRYWFFFQIFIYTALYFYLYRKTKAVN
jgi:UDP-N-acetylmuramyl pentapeptide phosphotransferase/UDP-N-acetylglucosamine-1-phosphate transferase